MRIYSTILFAVLYLYVQNNWHWLVCSWSLRMQSLYISAQIQYFNLFTTVLLYQNTKPDFRRPLLSPQIPWLDRDFAASLQYATKEICKAFFPIFVHFPHF